MTDDIKLLRAYSRGKSEGAFTELVNRHIGFVYSGALRRVGYDSHLAEDVTQAVFSDLARKAEMLGRRRTLSGWLYVSMHLASAAAVRKERRRKSREKAAGLMQETLEPPLRGPDEDRLRPLLDGLIVGLGKVDREAVVLRFFEKRSFSEIGASLNLSEDAARKRVGRALERLRSALAKSGVASGPAALSEMLAGGATAAPPAFLPAKVAVAAVAESMAAGFGTSLLLSLLDALSPGAVALAATFVAFAAALAWQHHDNKGLQSEVGALAGRDAEARSLRSDNERITGLLSLVDSRRRALDGMVTGRPSGAPSGGASGSAPSASVDVSVSAEGCIRWSGVPVTLAGFLDRLSAFRAQNPDPSAQVSVHGEAGAVFTATAYVVEQASKAEITNIVVDGAARPAGEINWVSMSGPAAGPPDVLPPSLPDPAPRR